jgi:uroporphyrinogen-III synthase
VEVPAYRTVSLRAEKEAVATAAASDAVVFAAGSAVRAYLDAGLPVPAAVVCIGPSTAEVARAAGLAVAAVAERPEPGSVLDAVVSALGGGGPSGGGTGSGGLAGTGG